MYAPSVKCHSIAHFVSSVFTWRFMNLNFQKKKKNQLKVYYTYK